MTSGSDLTRVPTREVPTDDDNIGLGPTKSNDAPVIDTAHELDAREEHLIRDWVRQHTLDVGVADASDGYGIGTTTGMGEDCLKGVVGRYLPRPTFYRYFDHFDRDALDHYWAITSGSPLLTAQDGGVLVFQMDDSSTEQITSSLAVLPKLGAMEIAMRCCCAGVASNDGSKFGCSLLDSAGTGVSLDWDGTTAHNHWTLSRLTTGSPVETAVVTGAATPSATYQDVRLGVAVASDGKWTPYACVDDVSKSLAQQAASPLGGPALSSVWATKVTLDLDLWVDCILVSAKLA